MQIGDGGRFLINYEILDLVDHWVLGRFYFVIAGAVIGDQDDVSVDLKGCVRWLDDFVGKPRNRYEPGLFELPMDQVFQRLAGSVLANEDQDNSMSETYENTYSRFHLSHIGMSSFDSTILLFIEDGDKGGRFLWKQRSGEISQAYVSLDEVRDVVDKAIRAMKKDIGEATRDRC